MRLHNDGDRPVDIAGVVTSCVCTKAFLSSRSIPAHGAVDVEITVRPVRLGLQLAAVSVELDHAERLDVPVELFCPIPIQVDRNFVELKFDGCDGLEKSAGIVVTQYGPDDTADVTPARLEVDAAYVRETGRSMAKAAPSKIGTTEVGWGWQETITLAVRRPAAGLAEGVYRVVVQASPTTGAATIVVRATVAGEIRASPSTIVLPTSESEGVASLWSSDLDASTAPIEVECGEEIAASVEPRGGGLWRLTVRPKVCGSAARIRTAVQVRRGSAGGVTIPVCTPDE